MENKINQKGINVENGSVVGRDQRNTTYNFNTPPSQMTRLCIAFMEEARVNETLTSILPELEHYMSNVDAEKVIGLEEKLKAANRHDSLYDAARQKEIVAKRLHMHATSKAAQRIYTFILGMLLHRFRVHVKPLIDSGANKVEVDKAALGSVIEPIMEQLDENVLDLYWDDIWGMIYYLTGNCHIKWAK